VDIGQGDRHAFLIGDVNAGNSRHLRISSNSGMGEEAWDRSLAKAGIIRIASAASIGDCVRFTAK
jgi:hypothetical protein